MYEKHNWTFSANVVKVFDEHIRNSVPLYDLFQKEIASMSVYFSQHNSKIIDIGTSTGSLINLLVDYNSHRNVSFIGIDVEPDMVEECKTRYSEIKFQVLDAVECDYTNASVVTSMLTLQFMEHFKRKEVLKRIYNQMNLNGALFIVEKVRSVDVEIHDIYSDLYYDFKRENFNATEILDKNQSLRGVMKPITMNENIEMLKSVGFKKVDIFMKINNFVGILAIK